MVILKPLTETRELHISYLDKLAKEQNIQSRVIYDEDIDALFVYFIDDIDNAIIHYIDKHIALIYEPTTKEVVGIQVEGFNKSFVKEYGQVEKVWRLSECCPGQELNDLGDIQIFMKRQSPVVAQEVAKVTENVLFGRNRKRRIPVPA